MLPISAGADPLQLRNHPSPMDKIQTTWDYQPITRIDDPSEGF